MNAWLSGMWRRLVAFALWMAARAVPVMLSFARRTRSSLRQGVVSVIQSIKEPGLPSWLDVLSRLPLVAVFVVLPIVVLILIRTEPVGGLVDTIDSVTFLGALLGAQAAVAALTLAVKLFLLQGVSARRDVDDRVYAEYIRRSWVWPVFCYGIGAVAFTGGVLSAERLVDDAGAVTQGAPGVSNLAILAVVALAVSLAAPVALFWRAIILAEPEHWQRLRLDVNKREVGEAVSAYLGRVLRAVLARVNNEADYSVLYPDVGERSADQAVRALLDDARRAMDERRHGELVRSLDSIRALVSYAMDEIEKVGIRWGPPGSEAQWPPLFELRQTLFSYREEVIRGGNREYLQALVGLDYWFVSTGLRRPCGDLFTFGLSGYRQNYAISARMESNDFHGMLRDRFLLNLDGLTFGHEPETLVPFMKDVIKHQGNVMSDALHLDKVDDFQRIHREFNSTLVGILERWEGGVLVPGRESEPSALLARTYRIALMALVGRAVILSNSGDLPDGTPYLDVARGTYTRPAQLADDVVAALDHERQDSLSMAHNWEVPDHVSGWSGVVLPERYALTCFAVILMEMAEDATLNLNLRGNAQYVLDWFDARAEGLEPFVRDTSAASAQQRREFAIEVLRKAVRRDVAEQDRKIINRELSAERISACRNAIHEGIEEFGSTQRMFEQAGTFARLVLGVVETRQLTVAEWVPKAYFVDSTEGDQIFYGPLDGDRWGHDLADAEVEALCRELDQAVPMAAPLDTVGALFAAVDAAMDDLNPHGGVGIVVAGALDDALLSLYSDEADDYQPRWLLPEPDSSAYIGRYRGYPVVRGSIGGGLRVYVVDLGTWGTMVRVPFGEHHDVLFEVKPTSAKEAQEMLDENPNHIPSEPCVETKLRKLQTLVTVRAAVRVGFQGADPARARRITANDPQNPVKM